MKIALTRLKPRRRPTWIGWMLIAIFFAGLFQVFLLNIYDFLAPEAPPHRGVMVVEGWIHDEALDEAIALYKSGDYSEIACTGVPITLGSYLQPFKSYAEMTADRLIAKGFARENILIAVAADVKQDRTYAAAVALRDLLDSRAIEEKRVHLVSVGPHARRSRMLFQKALGADYHVGVSSLEPAAYDSNDWHAGSEGVRAVISEVLAYGYARVLFQPHHE